MSLIGDTSGYQSLFNMSTNDSDNITVSNATVFNELDLKYIDPHSVLYTNANNSVVGSFMTNGQVLIGANSSAPVPGNITQTANQTTVTNGTNTIQIGTVQDIATTSQPTFNTLTLQKNGITDASITFNPNSFATTMIRALQATDPVVVSIPSIASNTSFVLANAGYQELFGTWAWNSINSSIYFNALTASLPLKIDSLKKLKSEAINLASTETSGILPIAKGGTNSGTALLNDKVMVSSSGSIVEWEDKKNIVLTYGEQTIEGYKYFSSNPGSSVTFYNGFMLSHPNCSVLATPNWIDSRTIYIPEPVNYTANVLLDWRPQSVYSQMTFETTPKLNSITPTRLIATNASREIIPVTILNGNGSLLSFSGGTLTASNSQDISTFGSPSFTGLTVSSIPANRFLITNALGQFVAGNVLSSTGMTYQALNGNIYIDTQQDLRDISSPYFSNVSLTDLTNNRLISKNSVSGKLESVNINTANGIIASVTNGTLTLYNSQNLTTSGNPQFTSASLIGSSPDLIINNNDINTNRASITLYGRSQTNASFRVQQDENGRAVLENFQPGGNILLQTNAGYIHCGSGVIFQTLAGTGGTGQTPLNYYYQEVITCNFTGARAFSLNIRFKRIGSQVFAFIPSSNEAKSTASATLTATNVVPVWARPVVDFWQGGYPCKNNTPINSLLWVKTNGDMVFYGSGSEAVFSNNQISAIRSSTVSWLVEYTE